METENPYASPRATREEADWVRRIMASAWFCSIVIGCTVFVCSMLLAVSDKWGAFLVAICAIGMLTCSFKIAQELDVYDAQRVSQ